MVELSHDSRPIIGRDRPLGAAFLALAVISIGLMVADRRYDQLERVRAALASVAHPLQRAVDFPFRAWDRVTGSFADRDSMRISQKKHPGWSRLYARVLEPGTIRAGDPVRIGHPG